MSDRNHLYCLADGMLFESPARLADEDQRFREARRAAPPNWRRNERDLWVALTPAGAQLPDQGWKIHASATRGIAPVVIRTVWDYCLDNGVAFKFLRTPMAQAAMDSKVSERGASSKLITIYPENDNALAAILTALSTELAGLPGPYILGDLRYGEGPLYVRYGAFTERYCADEGGEPVSAMFGESGVLVPDKRGPVFSVPDWVPLPEILLSSMRATERAMVTNFPYDIVEPLRFSNAGGIYLATERSTGRNVVLREARPYTGFDQAGDDAVTRLRRERDALTKLAGLACVPRLIEHTKAWEHEFLVLEYIEGRTLLELAHERNPYIDVDPEPEVVAAYGAWLDKMTALIAEALNAIHQRGIWYGDLHPGNVIVRLDDSAVVLIDFELATALSDTTPRGLHADGFAPPAELTGIEADQYALDCVRLFGCLPTTSLVARDQRKTLTLLEAAAEMFPSESAVGGTPELVARWPMLTRMVPALEPDNAAVMFAELPTTWPAIRDRLVAGIVESATPERDDRLFPGGPTQFATKGIAMRDGAAGVLLALHQVGVQNLDEHAAWLVRAAQQLPRGAQTGLLAGRHGVALVLDLLGHREDAHQVLALAREHDEWLPTAGLLNGRAGIVVTLLHFGASSDDTGLVRDAAQLGEDLMALVAGEVTPGELRQPTLPGLFRGFSGIALALLHLHHFTGEHRYLLAAEAALQRELDHTETRPDGSTHLVDGNRLVPNLEEGSAGAAIVLQELLRHRPDSELASALDGLRRACLPRMAHSSNLFQGRAGLIVALSAIGDDEDKLVMLRHSRDLGWHAIDHLNGLMFPGDMLRRLSVDLGTGSAGVLLALDTVFGANSRPVLPFFSSQGSHQAHGRWEVETLVRDQRIVGAPPVESGP